MTHRNKRYSAAEMSSEHGFEKEPSQPEEERYVQFELSNDEEAVTDDPLEPVLRRSERNRRPPKCGQVYPI
jgi:hypothetical protein